jgi:hypothetical protein
MLYTGEEEEVEVGSKLMEFYTVSELIFDSIRRDIEHAVTFESEAEELTV